MHFCLVDAVLEHSDTHIVTLKQVSAAEEYLQDHFPGFPVLPGVLMIEAMVQAARTLVESNPTYSGPRLVLSEVRALKYGSFVKPGHAMRITINLAKHDEDNTYTFKGEARVLAPGADPADKSLPTAVSGKFTLRPICAAPSHDQPGLAS